MSPHASWIRTGAMADIYEHELVPAIFGPWAADLIARAAPREGEQVLDVACGTGAVTRLAAQAVAPSGRVVGLDYNAAMLTAARAVPAAVPITWQEGSAVALPFADQTFDLVLCQQGLQYFPDRAAALTEMRRVLRDGGRLALSVWRALDHSPAFALLSQELERAIGPGAGVLPPFAMGDAEDVPRLVEAAGFRAVTEEVVVITLRFASPAVFVERYVAGSPLSATVEQAGEAARAAFVAGACAALQRLVDAGGLACPMAARVVLARR